MKKAEIITKANKEHNPVWALVDVLEKEGKIKKTNNIRKPAVYISETQMLINLSETEVLIVERVSATGLIVNYRLIIYNLFTGESEGGYNPF